MIRRSASRDRRGNLDCTSTTAKLASCSTMNSIEGNMGGSVVKSPIVNGHRRTSLRLKAINAIYQSEDGINRDFRPKLKQHASEDVISFVPHQIKLETPLPEQDYGPCKLNADHVNNDAESRFTENCGDRESNSDCDDLSINDMTLKDLQKRCKAKKRKVLKSVASTEADLESHLHPEDTLVKPEEEEIDFDEPLINFKRKLPKSSAVKKKRREHAHSSSSEPLVAVKGLCVQTCSSSSGASQGSIPVSTDRALTAHGFSMESTAGLVGLKKTQVENLKADSCDHPDAIYATELSNLDFSAKCNLSGEPSSVMPDKVEGGDLNTGVPISSSNNSPHCCANEVFTSFSNESMTDPLHAGSHKAVYNVKGEMLEISSLDGQSAANVGVSSTYFIEKCNFPDNSSTKLIEKVSGEENRESICYTSKYLHFNDMEMASHNDFLSSVSQPEVDLFSDIPGMRYSVESEILETDSSMCQNTVYIADSSTTDFISKFNFPESSSAELHERVDGGEWENGGSTCFTTKSPHCCVNGTSTECMKPDGYTSLAECAEENNEKTRNMGFTEMSIHKFSPSSVSETETVPICVGSSESGSATVGLCSNVYCSRKINSTPLEEIPFCTHDNSVKPMNCSAINNSHGSMGINNSADACALNKVSDDPGNLIDEAPLQEMSICSQKNDVDAYHSFLCKEVNDLGDVSKSNIEGESIDSIVPEKIAGDVPNNNEKDTIPPICDTSSMESYYLDPQGCHPCFSTANDSHASDDSSPQCEEFSSSTMEEMSDANAEKAAETTHSVVAQRLIEALDCNSPQISNPCLSTAYDLHSADASSKAAEGLSSSAPREPAYLSTEISHSITAEGFNTRKEFICDHGAEVEHPPKKLLSNRKDISPTSQEKLCQALNGDGLYDAIQLSKNRKRLCFEKWTKKRTSSSVSGHGEGEVMLSSERMMKKPKNNRNGFLPPITKGILKSPEASCMAPCSCMENSLLHIHTQKAITFSQRQMHDIEGIAKKLVKGLKSMKNIVEETLSSEACSSAPSKFTADEIRVATEAASELESTTKRWLTMMAKDCNRFCKIMSLAENSATTPINGVIKQRRISFADEAGGVLCHVKVLEQQPASVVVSTSMKADASVVVSTSMKADQ